jgi:GR25 family glycosyltransferase involved in LPS biosynthesis
MLPPVMVYAWTFIAATPSFRCKTPYDDFLATNLTSEPVSSYIPSAAQCSETQKTISLKECQRCFHIANISTDDGYTNQLTACHNFIFDRTYYQSTIVEDVSYF